MYTSNIVTNLPNINDDIIYKHTKQMLHDIEEKIELTTKFDSNYKIVFNIVKPIYQKHNFEGESVL